MPTTNRTYTALAHSEQLNQSGALRGNLDARQLRDGLRTMAGLVFVLAQHANDSGLSSDAIKTALTVSESLLDDLERTPALEPPRG